MPEHARLTDAERCVAVQVAQGRSTKEIALGCGISLHTARNHLASIYRKIGVSSRTEALLWAQEHDLCCVRMPWDREAL